MKPAQIRPVHRGTVPDRARIDWLTLLLICVAFFLIALLAAIGADVWLQGSAGGPVVEALGSEELTDPAAMSAAIADPSLPLTEPLTPTVTPTAATPPPCVPPDDWAIYVVQEGNTLYSLGQRYGTDVATLKLVNCLNTDTIFIDQRLYVPGPPPTAVVTPEVIAAQLTLTPPRPGASATPAVVVNYTPPPPRTAAPPGSRVGFGSDYVNIILLGSDKRPTGRAWRTDSMIVVSIDQTNKVVRLLSIPRDLWVYIPGHGYNRINTADLWGELAKSGGGPERVKQTVYQNLGIPIDYYIRVDFQGFMKIIDTLGGVDIDVECPLPDIKLVPGMYHMNGEAALRYARSRKSTNDFDRGRRQRKVVMALWDQALTLDVVPRLPQMWLAMADSFKTDLPLELVINLAYMGTTMERQRIRSKAIDASMTQSWMTPEGAAVLLPREDRIRAALQSFFAPLDTTVLDAGNQIRIQVMNAWPRNEAEQLAAAALGWEGYKVVGTGRYERQDMGKTEIIVYNGDQARGEQIARLLEVPLSSVRVQPDSSKPADVQVLLGADYNPCSR
jgi:polyisoprenyl-teichoic acid--peptidoglycan teichoic acid transferase